MFRVYLTNGEVQEIWAPDWIQFEDTKFGLEVLKEDKYITLGGTRFLKEDIEKLELVRRLI